MLTRVLVAAPGDPPAPTHDPAQVKGVTQQILRRPEFQPPRRGVLQAAWHWLTTELGKLLSHIFGGSGAGSGWGAVVVVVVVAVVVVGLVVMVVLRSRGRGGSGSRSPQVVLRGHGPSRSPAQWRAEAAAHEAAGRWRDALRCRYRALVAELVARGLVEEVPGRTSGEYRREVASVAPAVEPAFGGATDLFEQTWYGDRPTGREDQESFDELARRVLAPASGGTWERPR